MLGGRPTLAVSRRIRRELSLGHRKDWFVERKRMKWFTVTRALIDVNDALTTIHNDDSTVTHVGHSAA